MDDAFALVKVVAPVLEPKSSKSLFVNVLAAVKVCAEFSVSTVPVVAGKVIVVASVPLSVNELVKLSVLAAVPVSV